MIPTNHGDYCTHVRDGQCGNLVCCRTWILIQCRNKPAVLRRRHRIPMPGPSHIPTLRGCGRIQQQYVSHDCISLGSIELLETLPGRKYLPNLLDHHSIVLGCARHRRILASPKKVPLSGKEREVVSCQQVQLCCWNPKLIKPHHQHNATTSEKIYLPPPINRYPTFPRGCLL